MMSVMLSILVGIGSNFDNFAFQSARGQQEHRAPWGGYYVVAAISVFCLITGGMTALRLSRMIPGQTRYVVGAAILVCVGSWSMVQTLLPSASRASTGSPLRKVHFSSGGFGFGLNEMMVVGLANGLTALTVGFGVGFANLSLTTSVLSVGLCNFSFLTIPVWLGVSPRPPKWGKHVILVCSVLLIVSALQL